MKRLTPFIAAMVIALIAASASAWLRPRYEDAQVVERSELIVVGSIKPGSIQYIPHKKDSMGGMSWEHHAVLLVHQVLKGKCDEKEIPIIIHYGLEPLINGHSKHDGFEMNSPATGPVPAVAIWDEGGSEHGRDPMVTDAQKDNLWFLRRLSGEYGEKTGTGDLGIADPEDLQPIKLKDYFNCYLSKDPASAVRGQLQKQPEVAARATRYLDHLAVAEILKEPDAAVRVERLLPYYQSRITWGFRNEARDGIVAAGGTVAGPYLMGIYQESWDPNVRQEIIRMWADMRYAGCVDLLISLLETDDQFWAKQDLKPGWWNAGGPMRSIQRDRYSEVFGSVYALGQIGDPRAKDAIEQTRKHWLTIPFENKQIVEQCDTALKAFTPKEAKAP